MPFWHFANIRNIIRRQQTQFHTFVLRRNAYPLGGHRSYRAPCRGSNKGRSGGSARKLGGGRSLYPLFCPTSAKGGSTVPSRHETLTSLRSPALSQHRVRDEDNVKHRMTTATSPSLYPRFRPWMMLPLFRKGTPGGKLPVCTGRSPCFRKGASCDGV